jgi:hypothetical protein
MKRFILVALVLATSSAFAAEGKWSVGPQVGYTKPKNVDGGISFGGNVGYGLQKDIDVGAYFNYFKKAITTGVDSKFTSYGVEGSYNLADMPGLSVGAKLGFTSVDASQTVGALTVSGSSSEFSFGPKVAYDHGIADNMTVGIEGNYLIISNSGLLNFLAGLKYWF